MKVAEPPKNEKERLLALRKFEILDTSEEKVFDDLAVLASAICEVPIALISLVDERRQWFKSRVGLDAHETEREIAFCAHAIHEEQVLEVTDATEDDRFHDNPLVTGDPKIRFYAGAPLLTHEGFALGTLCVIDRAPRQLPESKKKALRVLARQVVSQLELRIKNRQLEKMNQLQKILLADIAHDLKGAFNGVINFSDYLQQRSESLEPSKIQEIAGKILRASTELYTILDQTVQWSQHQLDALKPKLETLELSSLLENAEKTVESAMRIKSIKLTKFVEPQLTVVADKIMTEAILRNLLANAIKYSQENGEVFVKARADQSRVIFSISNQGEPIDSVLAKDLFQPTNSGQKGLASETGHGLGLRICKAFSDLQGTDISYDAEFTQGAKFRLVFPAQEQSVGAQ